MDGILVVTQDHPWKKLLLRGMREHGLKLSFIDGLRSESDRKRVSQSDRIILDLSMLPQPESPTTNILRDLLRGKTVVVVHSPRAAVGLQQYRVTNIIGALDLVKKPYTDNEIIGFFQLKLGKLDKGKMGHSWLSLILHP